MNLAKTVLDDSENEVLLWLIAGCNIPRYLVEVIPCILLLLHNGFDGLGNLLDCLQQILDVDRLPADLFHSRPWRAREGIEMWFACRLKFADHDSYGCRYRAEDWGDGELLEGGLKRRQLDHSPDKEVTLFL